MSQLSVRQAWRRYLSIPIVAVFLLVNLSSCQLFRKREPHVQRYYDCFDTVSEITGFAESRGVFEAQVDALHAEMRRYHELFTDFSDGAEGGIYQLNQKAGQGPQKVDPLVFDLLDFAKAFCERSQGAVNVAMGAVTQLWYQAREEAQKTSAKTPDKARLIEAQKHSDLSKLVLDRSAGTVELLDPQMRLDCGAIAKGYAVELLARTLESRGLKGWLLNIGGNVRTVGGKGEQGKPWRIGIRQAYLPTEAEPPRQTEDSEQGELSTVGIYGIENQSLVSSGVYERYFLVDGRCYHHIIDPQTLQPELNYLQVSVLGPDSGICDGLSTALFNLSEEEGRQLLKAYGSGYGAQWVYPDGERHETELMAQLREAEAGRTSSSK